MSHFATGAGVVVGSWLLIAGTGCGCSFFHSTYTRPAVAPTSSNVPKASTIVQVARRLVPWSAFSVKSLISLVSVSNRAVKELEASRRVPDASFIRSTTATVAVSSVTDASRRLSASRIATSFESSFFPGSVVRTLPIWLSTTARCSAYAANATSLASWFMRRILTEGAR